MGCGKNPRTLTVFDDLPTTLNPLYAVSDPDFRAQELIYERVFYRPHNSSDIQSDMVRQVSYRADRNDKSTPAELVVSLREDRRWSHGGSITPEDLCFTVNALIHPANDVRWADAHRQNLAGCDVEEEQAIVRFRRRVEEPREWLMVPLLPAHRFDSTIVSPDHIAARRAYGVRNTKAELLQDRVVVEVVRKKEAPNIKRLEIRPMDSADWALEQLEIGQAQGIVSLPASFWERAENDITLNTVNFSEQAWWFIAVNIGSGPGAIPEFRQALDSLIDRELLLSQMNRGPLCANMDALAEPSQACDGDNKATPVSRLISGPFTRSSPYYNDEVPVSRPDPEQAKQLLTDLGWEHTEGWQRESVPVELRIGISSADHNRQPELLAALSLALQGAGFTVSTQVVDGPWPRRNEDVASQFDLFIGRWHERTPGPQIQGLIGANGADNLFNHNDETVEALFRKRESAATQRDERWVYDVHAHLAESRPLLFLWSTELRSVWRKEFRGALRPSPFYYYTDFMHWSWLIP